MTLITQERQNWNIKTGFCIKTTQKFHTYFHTYLNAVLKLVLIFHKVFIPNPPQTLKLNKIKRVLNEVL